MSNAFEATENFQEDFNQGFMDRLRDFNQDDVPPVILAGIEGVAKKFSEVSNSVQGYLEGQAAIYRQEAQALRLIAVDAAARVGRTRLRYAA